MVIFAFVKNATHIGLLTRIICGLLSIYFLNVSIDTADVAPDHIAEDLAINDIESIAEFVTEEVLDLTNAFSEHDEHDSDDKGTSDSARLLYCYTAPHTLLRPHVERQPDNRTLNPVRSSVSARSVDVASPPPKA